MENNYYILLLIVVKTALNEMLKYDVGDNDFICICYRIQFYYKKYGWV